MNNKELEILKQNFLDYAATFIEQGMDGGPHVLKKDHTIRVCQEILGLGKELGLSQDDTILAQAMAMLHDIGRFEQFKTYNTFLDSISENHAALGLKVIKKEKILDHLPFHEKKLILDAIEFHNAADLPNGQRQENGFFHAASQGCRQA